MAIEKQSIDNFLQLAARYPVLDVRSPGEYAHAHIPGAYSFPLFSDEERKIIGTQYKQESREKAIKTGLDFFGAKMRPFVEAAESIVQQHNPGSAMEFHPKTLLIHCWRGGMRSAAVAWLMDLYGFRVITLPGGYKKFRQWVGATLSLPFPLQVVGGNTGSGKTALLDKLQRLNYPVVDLEAIAEHRGSAFGNIENRKQPSQEMFENRLAMECSKWVHLLNNSAVDSAVWLEDESQRIGDINIPNSFFKKMRQAPLFLLDIPFDTRLEYLVKSYGTIDKEKLVNAIIRIRKRLGGLETKMAIEHLLDDRLVDCFSILLRYYDKYYNKGLAERRSVNAIVQKIESNTTNPDVNIEKLLSVKLVTHES